MKTLLTALSLLIATSIMTGQSELVNSLKTATDAYTKAIVGGNVDAILETVHPNIMEMGGGEDFLRKDVIADLEAFKNSGVDYTTATANDPSESYQVDRETFYLVPVEWTATLGTNTYKSTQHVLASTEDEGDSWSFINISKFSAKNLAVYIKGFDETIEFPAPGPLESIN